MTHRWLAALALCSTASLSAQYFVPDQVLTRRMTRVTWLGQSGEQSLAIDYGQSRWLPEYDKFMQERTARHARLGSGAWTTLQSGVGFSLGGTTVPAGRWYLGAHRNDKQDWTVTLMAAERLDAAGLGAGATISITPDRELPMRLERTTSASELLDIRLASNPKGKANVRLTLTWGSYRLSGDLVADFDLRQSKDAPTFARSAPDKVITTSSGLQYEQLRAGVGDFPGATDKVTVHYCGWLVDGTQFDSSYRAGQPVTMPLDQVVKGFREGVQLMQPGAIFRLTIPPALAYGAAGAGDVIPPNSTLVFTVTLLGVAK